MIRHDRTGEPIEDDDETAVGPPESDGPVPHECDNGFVDRNADPPMKPCLICRPDLSPEKLRLKAFGPPRDDDRPDPLHTKRNLETS